MPPGIGAALRETNGSRRPEASVSPRNATNQGIYPRAVKKNSVPIAATMPAS